MSENMPSHSFVARYPNYVQDASSTCICGEIKDSSVHDTQPEDERVKEAERDALKLIDQLEGIEDLLSRGPWEASQPDPFPYKVTIGNHTFNTPPGSAQIRAEQSSIPSHCLIPSGIIHHDDAEGIAELRNMVPELIKTLQSLLPVQPAQQEDDGWVTFGRIKTDIESETETFERIPVQPAASTPTERCTCDHFEHKDTGECLTCGMFCGLVNPTTDEVIILRLIVRALAEYLETDQILSAVSGMGIINDNTRTLIQSIVGTAADVSTYRSRCCDARVIIGSNGSVECSRCHTDYWTNLPTPAVATGNKGQR